MSDSETDTETTYSNSIDSDNSDLYYEAEEISRTKYNIILCEIFNDKIHGTPINEKLNSHFLINSRFKILDISVTNNVCIHYNRFYSTLHLTNPEYSIPTDNPNIPFVKMGRNKVLAMLDIEFKDLSLDSIKRANIAAMINFIKNSDNIRQIEDKFKELIIIPSFCAVKLVSG